MLIHSTCGPCAVELEEEDEKKLLLAACTHQINEFHTLHKHISSRSTNLPKDPIIGNPKLCSDSSDGWQTAVAKFKRNPLLVVVSPTKALEYNMEAKFKEANLSCLVIDADTLDAARASPLQNIWMNESKKASGLYYQEDVPGEYPKSLFTFALLKEIHTFTSKKGVYNFVRVLGHLTDNGFPHSVKNHYQVPAHLSYIHRIELSRDGNFGLQKKSKHDDPNDHNLAPHQGCFVDETKMGPYVKQIEEEDTPTTCSGFQAGKAQRYGKSRHLDLCHTVYALCYTWGAGIVSGESVEHPWSEHNQVGLSTRKMSAGGHHDTLNDFLSFWNWLKGAANVFLGRKLKEGLVGQERTTAYFRGLTALAGPDNVSNWEQMSTDAVIVGKGSSKKVESVYLLDQDADALYDSELRQRKILTTELEDSLSGGPLQGLARDLSTLLPTDDVDGSANDHPEDDLVGLPSDFTPEERSKYNLHLLAQQEQAMRLGRAYDLLAAIQEAAKHKAAFIQHKKDNARGQKDDLRAGVPIRMTEENCKRLAKTYHYNYTKLLLSGLDPLSVPPILTTSGVAQDAVAQDPKGKKRKRDDDSSESSKAKGPKPAPAVICRGLQLVDLSKDLVARDFQKARHLGDNEASWIWTTPIPAGVTEHDMTAWSLEGPRRALGQSQGSGTSGLERVKGNDSSDTGS
ncbi:hypothetical protein EUX98_g5085 [Antrodiella citrinella]|uniref:Uncharacterized protein n=1 Tax=Antrodiella citrinella TaxID=2447956 RepID=A0A4S4MV73_9APHY|nr:hypothetical protein EUX98_g5085 [Antrodiella citrinella]